MAAPMIMSAQVFHTFAATVFGLGFMAGVFAGIASLCLAYAWRRP